MLRFDAPRLRWLIEKHLHYTNSDRARQILDNWEATLPKFLKIMPVDFRRAMDKLKERGRTTERTGDAPPEG